MTPKLSTARPYLYTAVSRAAGAGLIRRANGQHPAPAARGSQSIELKGGHENRVHRAHNARAGADGCGTQGRTAGQNDIVPEMPELAWPLPSGDRSYGSIDGKRIWQYVVQQAEISRHYRDQGHPQFWGRIIATSGDAEDARWLADRFSRLGLSDVHIQSLNLEPQWIPQSWKVTVTSGETSTTLESAQPAYRSPGTQASGVDLQAVYVGEGMPADLMGREVRGKAVFMTSTYSTGSPQLEESQVNRLQLAASKGAAALFYAYTVLPGNVKYQAYPTGTNVPTFVLGRNDGHAIEEMIARARKAVRRTSGSVWMSE